MFASHGRHRRPCKMPARKLVTGVPAVMSAVPDPPVSGRILAIDDDRQLLESFAMFLTERGHRVTTAETLADGLKHAATQPFHVCLLDRTIGYDSGLAALPRLRELAPQMRVIMVTG